MVRQMSRIFAEQDGVVGVPDLFALVIGPSSLPGRKPRLVSSPGYRAGCIP
jgi:hypothetical protein